MTIKGVIHGTRTVELKTDAQLPDGAEVEVTLHALKSTEKHISAEALKAFLSVAGACADDPDFDRDMELIARDRKNAAHRDPQD